MTDQQIALVFEALLGLPPRGADLAVLKVLSPSGVTAADLAVYIWDHWLGEPDEPTLEEVEAAVRAALGEEQQCA